MTDINKIIILIDSYLEMKGLEYVEPNEISKFLDKYGVLSYSTKGQPLRKLLREGVIPNAFKISGNRWVIGHSNKVRIVNTQPIKEEPIIRKIYSPKSIVKCLNPIADVNSQILILGTLPGKISLQTKEYYASPNNQFWGIIAEILKEALPLSYNAKLTMLKKHHIALWDVLYSANRVGSLDADIKNPIANDIVGFVTTHPSLQKIVFNGKEAEKKFYELIGTRDIPEHIKFISMPSTSHMNTHFSLEDKKKHWSCILE